MEYSQITEVNYKMQKKYNYQLSVGVGKEFSLDFEPFYTPGES